MFAMVIQAPRTLTFFYAFGDLLFVSREDAIERLKKSRQKMPLSIAERLAQRKPFLWSYTMRWPSLLRDHKNVCCETDLHAVRHGFK